MPHLPRSAGEIRRKRVRILERRIKKIGVFANARSKIKQQRTAEESAVLCCLFNFGFWKSGELFPINSAYHTLSGALKGGGKADLAFVGLLQGIETQ